MKSLPLVKCDGYAVKLRIGSTKGMTTVFSGLPSNQKDLKMGETKPKKVYFPVPHTQIPILSEGGIRMVQWGRRNGEDDKFDVPQTGWARLESLVEHKWDKYNSSRVRIPAVSWIEKDPARESHWFNM
jgi:hypothetical protein